MIRPWICYYCGRAAQNGPDYAGPSGDVWPACCHRKRCYKRRYAVPGVQYEARIQLGYVERRDRPT